MDYEKTLAAAGGSDMLKEALIDAILQVRQGQKLFSAEAFQLQIMAIHTQHNTIHTFGILHAPRPTQRGFLFESHRIWPGRGKTYPPVGRQELKSGGVKPNSRKRAHILGRRQFQVWWIGLA